MSEVLTLREAQPDDVGLYFNWANEPSVRAAAIQQDLIKWSTHNLWFEGKLANPYAVLYVASDLTGPVGQIRFDVVDNVAEIDYSIETKARGRGYGKTLVALGINRLRQEFKLAGVKALVRQSNIPSCKVFERLGFEPTAVQQIKGVDYQEYQWENLLVSNIVIANSNPIHGGLEAYFSSEYAATCLHTRSELNYERLLLLDPQYIFFPHWSFIIPRQIYERFRCVVFHMTDLPYGRGGSPLQNLIVRGHKETQISALRVSKGLDTGPIYLKRPLSLHGTATEIFLRAGSLMREMIETIVREQPEPQPQVGEPVLFKRRQPEDGDIQPLSTLAEVYNYIRMLDADGYPPAFLETEHFRLEFSRAARGTDQIIADVRITKK